MVEIDPLVYSFATQYFGLPPNHTAVLSDAVSWTARAVAQSDSIPSQTYTYILHDVFTGGSTPLKLFTFSFLSSLRRLLHPAGGVIAINFAGDLSLSPAPEVLYTINKVFKGRCRAFRDSPSPYTKERENGAGRQGDLLNLVVYCVNLPTMWPLEFRDPEEADYLQSGSRRRYLVPRTELELEFPGEYIGKTLITEGNLGSWKVEQLLSARRHWRMMREAVPAIVWQTW